jgi:hypothetical protein
VWGGSCLRVRDILFPDRLPVGRRPGTLTLSVARTAMSRFRVVALCYAFVHMMVSRRQMRMVPAERASTLALMKTGVRTVRPPNGCTLHALGQDSRMTN